MIGTDLRQVLLTHQVQLEASRVEVPGSCGHEGRRHWRVASSDRAQQYAIVESATFLATNPHLQQPAAGMSLALTID